MFNSVLRLEKIIKKRSVFWSVLDKINKNINVIFYIIN